MDTAQEAQNRSETMIFGKCPYCDGNISNPIGDPPCWSFPSCEHCGKTYALFHSRIHPVAMTKEDFDKDYVIEGNTIKDR